MNAIRSQRGISLVEASIILLVLMLLTGVIAPSITESVTDAKRVKVKDSNQFLFSSPKNVKPWPPIPPKIQSPVMSDPWGHRIPHRLALPRYGERLGAGQGEGQLKRYVA